MDMITLAMAKSYADEAARQAVLTVLSNLPILDSATLEQTILG